MASRYTAVAFDGKRLALRGGVRPLFSDSSADRARMKCQMLGDDAPVSWVECAYESQWEGHPAGPFAFTREVFADVIKNFDADEQPVPFLYGHPRHDLGNAIDAAGWIQAFEVRDGAEGAELWALVEWTADAAERIKAGKQRFCSVVIDFEPIDRATGESAGRGEIFEVGLVPSPFLPGMSPITLSRAGAPARTNARSLSMDPKKVLSAIAKALGLPDTAAPEKMKRAFDALVALMGAMSEDEMAVDTVEEFAAMKDAEAKLSRVIAKLSKGSRVRRLMDEYMEASEDAAETASTMLVGKLMTATGLDEAALMAGVEANLDAIVALITGTPAAGGVDAAAVGPEANPEGAALERQADRSRIAELSARANDQSRKIAALEADLAKRTAAETQARIAASFARLVEAGKAGESERVAFVKLSARDESIALESFESRTPVLPPAGQTVTGPKAAQPRAAVANASRNPDSPEAIAEATFRRDAKALGLRGAEADKHVAAMFARHNPANSGA